MSNSKIILIPIFRFCLIGLILPFLSACQLSLISDVTPPPGLEELSTEQPPGALLNNTEQEISTAIPQTGALSSMTATSPAASISLTITGKVINHSEKDLAKDLMVTLHGFSQSIEVYTRQTFIDDNGNFIFDDVQINPAWVIFTSTDFNQITYHSDVVSPPTDSSTLDLSIPVYGTTTDLSVLTIERLHIFLEFISTETLRVVQLYVISNNSPMLLTSAAPGGPIVPFNLPKQASNLKFLDSYLGERYQQMDNGFADTTAVLPGEGSYQIMFAYDLPFDQKVDIVQTMTLPVQNIDVMASSNDHYHTMRIKGDFLKTTEMREIGGTTYDTYRGERISAGDKLQITIQAGQDNLLSTRWPVFLSGTLNDMRVVIGAAFLGLTLVFFGIWLLFRERRTKQSMIPAREAEQDTFMHPEALMDAIIALDDIYKSGDLPEKAYQERRTILKTRLSELLKE